jgi:flagellin-like protein
MYNKKGISPIIATVLLLGFAISLATTVFLWMKGQTETMSESTVEYAEGEMQCQNVRINVEKTGAPVPPDTSPTCASLKISNKGYMTINQLAVRTFNPEGSKLYPQSPDTNYLNPQSSNCIPPCGVKTETGCSGCKKVEVMPIIKIGERLVGCKDRTVVVTCS